VHDDSQEALAAAAAGAAERVCPRIDRDCNISPVCPDVAARCAGFACRGIDSECLDACAALGCTECAPRCVVASACVATAADCAAVDTCSSSGRLIWGSPFDATGGCLGPPEVVGIVDAPITGGTADVTCGIGPDGRTFVFYSGTFQGAVGFPRCDDATASTATGAPLCDA
jgi:hypothetical protein